MTKTKLAKFEGTLGEFLEQYVEGVKFYQMDAGHAYNIEVQYTSSLVSSYKDGIWVEKEQTWEDYVRDSGRVLCVVNNGGGEDLIVTINEIHVGTRYEYEDISGDSWLVARPATQGELEEYIWKG